MALLSSVGSPQALKRLTPAECVALAGEIREFLVDRVAKTGGHLGPNLGAVELTIAVHRVFDSPHDRLLWDTGHQAYVHKMLTGRQDGFDTLRQKGGTTSSRTATPPPHCPTRTDSPRPSRCAGSAIGPWSRSSATARSPGACAGRR
jgi:1-deoxy-D-xylulose-5-phosphate synthase